jgi:hypothetical protein
MLGIREALIYWRTPEALVRPHRVDTAGPVKS